MPRLWWFALAPFCALHTLAGGLAGPPQPVSAVCEFEAPQFRTNAAALEITVAGCDTWERVGEPRLPFRTLRLLLPPGGKVAAVTAVPESPVVALPGEWRVPPGRVPLRSPRVRSPGPAGPPPAPPETVMDRADTPFPQSAADLASVQRLGGYSIAFVRVYPLEYSPLSGRLVFSPRLRVTVQLAPGDPPGDVGRPGRARARSEVVAWVQNPALAAAYDEPGAAAGDTAALCDYLLITRSDLTNAFQPLLNRKIADGLRVQVETVEAIRAAQPGRDLAEKIRNYIRDAYTRWGITYVLLGGDTATVPVRYAYAYMGALESGAYPRHLPACDLYYGCLDGSWDADGDGTFGEPTDGEGGGEVDLLAEVYVGRAPVDTAAEVGRWVEKSVRYESQGAAHPDGVLFLSEYLGTEGGVVAQGRDILGPLTNDFAPLQITWLDDAPFTTPQWSSGDALRELNRSPHLVLFAGHGTADTLMGLVTEDLDGLTNVSPFLLCSVTCDAGAFDNDNLLNPFDCVGEEWVKRNDRGAFAGILNSREGWYDAQTESKWSGEFQIQLFDQVVRHGRTRLGMAHESGRASLISKVESTGLMTYRFCYFEINLLGDPHLALQLPAGPAQLQLTLGWSADPGVHGPVVRWPSVPDRWYTVLRADSPEGPFTAWTDRMAATPPTNTFSDPTAAARAFYRVAEHPSP